MKVNEIHDFMPSGENPFNHDIELMGIRIGTNVTVMFRDFDNERQRFIFVIDHETGQRVKIEFPKEEDEKDLCGISLTFENVLKSKAKR